jgi:hypothetical protein
MSKPTLTAPEADEELELRQEPAETVRLDIYANEPYESAAKILAVLAHPVHHNDREKFETAIRIKAVATLAEADHRWGDRHRAMGPSLPFMRRSKVEAAFKTGFKKINEFRMIAAFQAEPTYRSLDVFFHGIGTLLRG